MLPSIIKPSQDLFPEISSMLSDFVDNAFPARSEKEGLMMPIDLIETEKEFILKADLPGTKREDLKVSVDKNTLTISGKSNEKRDKLEGTVYRDERYKGDYHRMISFHIPVDLDNIKARLEDGVLLINVPKREIKPKKEINIS